MLRWIFAKGFAGITLFAGVAIFYAERTDYLSIPQLVLALAGFLVLAVVAALLNAKPRSVGKIDKRPRADLQKAEAINAKVKAGTATPKGFEAVKPHAKTNGLPIPLGFDPHQGPAIVLARHRRAHGFDVTHDGTSWFGGLPALGPTAWPCTSSGRPMAHLAQIDLASLAATIGLPGLPVSGSLAFFANDFHGEVEGAVRYLHGATGTPTPSPAGMYPIENGAVGGPMRRGEDAEKQVLYPRMAIEMVALPAIDGTDADGDDAYPADLLGPKRDSNLSLSNFAGHFPAGDKPINRDSVGRFAYGAGLSLANGERARAAIEKSTASYRQTLKDLAQRLPELTRAASAPDAAVPAIEALKLAQSHIAQMNTEATRMDYELSHWQQACANLQNTVTAMKDRAEKGDRWAMLTKAEQTEIAPSLAHWTNRNALGYMHLAKSDSWKVHRSMQSAASETLCVMAVAPNDQFAHLPVAVQTALNDTYRQPIWGLRHQMFGRPQNLQSAAEDFHDHYLLLQINTDDLQCFFWGDVGVLQFWITPADLVSGNWSAVKISLECQ